MALILPAMRQAVVLPLLIAAIALLVGVGGILNGLYTIRNRSRMTATYRTLGGPVYSAAQFGCGGALILLGLAIVILVVIFRG